VIPSTRVLIRSVRAIPILAVACALPLFAFACALPRPYETPADAGVTAVPIRDSYARARIEMVAAVNEDRGRQGMPPVALDSLATVVAQGHAEEMAAGGWLSHFNAAGLKFNSDAYEWLTISGAKARYRGTGSVNGVSGYSFELTAWDGNLTNPTGPDKFRIKIWDKGTNTIVYDNQMGALEDSPAATAISGGSIVIHSK